MLRVRELEASCGNKYGKKSRLVMSDALNRWRWVDLNEYMIFERKGEEVEGVLMFICPVKANDIPTRAHVVLL